MYVLVYKEGCTTPGEGTLSLEWESLETCGECTDPIVNNLQRSICDCDGDGVEVVNLNDFLQFMVDPTHPYYNLFGYLWYSDSSYSVPVANPTATTVSSGSNTFYLKVEYSECQQSWEAEAELVITVLPSDATPCIEFCSGEQP